jgi:N-acetylneuraminic acid mutarotase
MADLPGESGIVMLAGADIGGPPNLPDMWAFEGSSGWQDITPGTLPEPVQGAAAPTGNAFEFDVRSGVGVFVDIDGNVWIYDPEAGAWEPRETSGGPHALLGTTMVYDSRSDRMILFGGLDLGDFSINKETWAFDVDSNTWERMHPKKSPSPRNYYQMAYDERSDRVILFGGGPESGVLGDTWAYDYESDTWTRMSPAISPPGRTYGWMVYDPRADRMVLYGGSEDQETAAFDDTWTYDYDTNRWTQLAIEGPSARAWHAMSYDDRTQTIVLFGGGTSRDDYLAETWVFDPATQSWELVD